MVSNNISTRVNDIYSGEFSNNILILFTLSEYLNISFKNRRVFFLFFFVLFKVGLEKRFISLMTDLCGGISNCPRADFSTVNQISVSELKDDYDDDGVT